VCTLTWPASKRAISSKSDIKGPKTLNKEIRDMSDEKVFEYYYLMGGKRIDQIPQYVQMIRIGENFQPDLMIIIDAFTEKKTPANQITTLAFLSESVMKEKSNTHTHYLFLGNEYYTPGSAGISDFQRAEELTSAIQASERIFVVMPYTIRHYLFSRAFIENKKHRAYNSVGELHHDASWVLLSHHSKPINHFLSNVIGYAYPYPDQTGDGVNTLADFLALRGGGDDISFMRSNIESIERVRNSIELSKSTGRITEQANNTIQVKAVGFGWFHTGTLIAKIREIWPKTKLVVIINDRGVIARKTNSWQYTVVFIDAIDQLRKQVLKILENENSKKHVKIESPHLYHLCGDVYRSVSALVS